MTDKLIPKKANKTWDAFDYIHIPSMQSYDDTLELHHSQLNEIQQSMYHHLQQLGIPWAWGL